MKLFDHPLLAVKLLQEREDSETVIVVSMESGGGGGLGCMMMICRRHGLKCLEEKNIKS